MDKNGRNQINLTNHPSTDYSYIVLPLKNPWYKREMHLFIISQYYPPETGALATRWGDYSKLLVDLGPDFMIGEGLWFKSTIVFAPFIIAGSCDRTTTVFSLLIQLFKKL